MERFENSLIGPKAKQFAIDVIYLVRLVPRDLVNDVITKQLIRCATSMGANYRIALRGKSRADEIAKLGIVLEEADECIWWFDFLEISWKRSPELERLQDEANQIVSMTVASISTLKRRSVKK